MTLTTAAPSVPDRCHGGRRPPRDSGTDGLLSEAARKLRSRIGYDAAVWFGADPLSLLPTAPVLLEGQARRNPDDYWDRDQLAPAGLTTHELADDPVGARTLSCACDDPGGDPSGADVLRGPHHRLRVVMRFRGTTWGVIDLFRARGSPAFDDAAVAGAIHVAGNVARRLAARVRAERMHRPDAHHGPGTLVVDADAHLLAADGDGRHWLQELTGRQRRRRDPLHGAVLRSLVRAAFVGATARVRTGAGRWLVVRASRLDGELRAGALVVMIEPASPEQLAPIVVAAHGLTEREQEVTRLVAAGLSDEELGRALNLSPHTVRDHLKSIFAKTDVTSRGELVATLYVGAAAQCCAAPRLIEG